MKKVIRGMLLVFLLMIPGITVYAGSINDSEAAIMTVVQSEHEYNGAVYKITDTYVGRVRAYLSQDDVDMSAGEVQSYIQKFYANIQSGIDQGYLVKVRDLNPEGGAAGTGNGDAPAGDVPGTDAAAAAVPEAAAVEPQTVPAPAAGEATAAETPAAPVEKNDNTAAQAKAETEKATVSEQPEIDEKQVIKELDEVFYVCDTEELIVGKEASEDAEEVYRFAYADEVTVTGLTMNGYFRVETPDGEGYVLCKFLTPDKVEVGVETTSAEESDTVMSESSVEETETLTDLSDTQPLRKSVSVAVIAVIVIVVVIIVAAVVVLFHRKKYKK